MCQTTAKMGIQDEEIFEEEKIYSFNEDGAIAEIFPNPNDGNMQLQYHIAKEDNAIVKIFNPNGKI